MAVQTESFITVIEEKEHQLRMEAAAINSKLDELVELRRLAAHVFTDVPSSQPERPYVPPAVPSDWNSLLRGKNQRECIIEIARASGGTLDIPAAAKIMVDTKMLKGKLAASEGLSRSRCAYLARDTGLFNEIDSRLFKLR